MHVLRMESCLDLPHKSKELLSLTIACAHVVMTVALQSRVVNLIMKLKLKMVTVVLYF